MMQFYRTLSFILRHPLNRHARWAALKRYGSWHLGSRLVPGAVAVPFVDDARLLVTPGVTGATGNIYTGLHEFEDMAFVLHALRPGDLFVDVGANVGSYTVLAAAVCNANVIAIEPLPETFERLTDNINLNRISDRVQMERCGVAAEVGKLRFTCDLDTMNHVVAPNYPNAIDVPVRTLDEIVGDRRPMLVKIDVEGFEHEVLSGGASTFAQNDLEAVIVEANGSNKQYGIEDNDVNKKLITFGFSAYTYVPATRAIVPRESISRSQGNVLYLRRPDWVLRRLRDAPTRSIHDTRV